MKSKEIIGIDVSKLYILSKGKYSTVENSPPGFSRLLKFGCTQLKRHKTALFFCFENTGRYNRLLSVFLHEERIQYAMVGALDVKQSKGLVRGKSEGKTGSPLR